MYRRKVKKGLPYTFQVFAFYSPRQFDKPVDIEDKEFITKIKICTNSNRCFTGPFLDEVVGEYELTNKEFKQIMDLVEQTPGVIIYGMEYTITDDYNGLWKYYGNQEDRPMPIIMDGEQIED
jgi:hypothetical protein